MTDFVFERVVQELNRRCGLREGFSNVERVRKGVLENSLVFETTVGEVTGSVLWENEDLIIFIGDQVVTLSLLDFLGRPN